eukprot:scaffold82685_cov30-Tisochrysis_lutea.AAC.1
MRRVWRWQRVWTGRRPNRIVKRACGAPTCGRALGNVPWHADCFAACGVSPERCDADVARGAGSTTPLGCGRGASCVDCYVP